MSSEFRNEPIMDFSRTENRKQMEEAIKRVRTQLGREYDLLIGGDRVKAPEQFTSYNPARKDEAIGVFQKATSEMAAQAVEVAAEAYESWRSTPAKERSEILARAAQIMRGRRFEMNAWMVLETGKNWVEADADTAEAIDFLDYYALEALRYDEPQPVTPIDGEENGLFYIPMGVTAVIPPWNFPNAILCGMTSAALGAGNSVVLKPSSDSPAIGRQVVDILLEAGIPQGVLNYVTGPGSTAGDTLVTHPKTRLIAFTGSKEVGLHIVEAAAKMSEGQKWIKRVSAEMGGKDAIIVDSEAKLDAAAAAIVASAFGFQGQKCSACSRAIIDEKVYDDILGRIVEQTRAIKVGTTEDADNYMGPVINASAYENITNYIEKGKTEGRLLCGGEYSDGEGYFIQPTIIADVDPHATIAQEEIFGPVLACIKARDFEHALEIANDTEYGLTGACYSENEEKLERARNEFYVGNLYLNRKCTGALVGGHPFGGFNMSGTNTKAGGPDYFLFFMQAKSVSRAVR